MNDTLSIGLSQSWTNDSVSINVINKTAPIVNYAALWADPNNQSFYQWAGEQSFDLPRGTNPPIPSDSLWQFTVDGNGKGSWSQQSIASNSIFPSLTRPAAAYVAYGNGVGYALGGYSSARTSPQTAGLTSFQPIPGLVSYNTTSNQWSNDSATGFSTYGTAEYGQMHYVPGFGSEGILVVVGGETSNQIAWTDTGSNLLSFATINIYDPSNKTWYNQSATGQIPESRDRFCSVGVQGDNGTYELFIHGGHVAGTHEPSEAGSTAQSQQELALDEVFVLTLPGFNWIKANYTPASPRMEHSCNLVGNSQMLVIGGLDPSNTAAIKFQNQTDPNKQGLGIFDLHGMEWSNNYDANAPSYTSPDAVKAWYRQNGEYAASWTDSSVEALFVKSC